MGESVSMLRLPLSLLGRIQDLADSGIPSVDRRDESVQLRLSGRLDANDPLLKVVAKLLAQEPCDGCSGCSSDCRDDANNR